MYHPNRKTKNPIKYGLNVDRVGKWVNGVHGGGLVTRPELARLVALNKHEWAMCHDIAVLSQTWPDTRTSGFTREGVPFTAEELYKRRGGRYRVIAGRMSRNIYSEYSSMIPTLSTMVLAE